MRQRPFEPAPVNPGEGIGCLTLPLPLSIVRFLGGTTMPDDHSSFSVTSGSLPGSKKIWVEGAMPGVRVAMREVHLEPIPLYDPSGP